MGVVDAYSSINSVALRSATCRIAGPTGEYMEV